MGQWTKGYVSYLDGRKIQFLTLEEAPSFVGDVFLHSRKIYSIVVE